MADIREGIITIEIIVHNRVVIKETITVRADINSADLIITEAVTEIITQVQDLSRDKDVQCRTDVRKNQLPLPNPDCHEVIGAKLGIEPQKVFFGINLVRQKMMLPKLPFPKRKLAISPDQMMAIKALYEPLLPLPPIGCHKIIAAQLKMDEWRVHVGIKLIRAQLGLDRWNEDRADKPADYMVAKHTKPSSEEKVPVAVEAKKAPEQEAVKPEPEAEPEVEEKPKRGRKPKKKEDEE